jgi:hypothetical protein
MGRAEVETLEQFASCWEGLEDPRNGNAAFHDFHELLMIAVCCVLCGGLGAVDMAAFAEAKEPFLRGFLILANGLPSHGTANARISFFLCLSDTMRCWRASLPSAVRPLHTARCWFRYWL